MNEQKLEEHLNWLSASLESQRNCLSTFLSRLRGIASRVGNSISLHKKFMRLMDQVADDRQKELDIISKIEAVERRHHEMKQLRLLRRADADAEEKRKLQLEREKKGLFEDEEDEESPHRLSWLEIVILYFLFCTSTGLLAKFNPFSNGSNSGPEKDGPQIK